MNPQNLTTLSDYLGVLRRRLWIVILCMAVAAGSAYAYSKHQVPQYTATATVGLSPNPISSLLTTQRPTQTSLGQYVAGEVQFADSPPVAAAALKQHRAALAAQGISGLTPRQLQNRTTVTGDTVNDQLTFTSTSRTAAQAQALVNAYAAAYVATANARDHATAKAQLKSIKKQMSKVNALIAAAVKSGNTAIAQAKGQQLKVLQAAQTTVSQAALGITQSRNVHAADRATKVRPVLSRNVGIGLALGLVIGLTLIGLAEALDNRVRRSEDLSAALRMPMLSKIPTPPRGLRRGDRLAMLDGTDDVHAEPYRKLRVGFDFANLRTRAKLVMVSSAVEQEGKSTTVANLAVAFARAGRKVVLVDLDLRRPSMHRFFKLGNGVGVTDVALGHAELERALHRIELHGTSGSLDVVPTGPLPPHPADFLETPALVDILRALTDAYDVVLLDSAPVLPVSDSAILSQHVQAIVVVARASTLKRHVLADFQRALAALPAPKLGFILTAAEDETAGYGPYGGGEPMHAEPSPERGQNGTNGREAPRIPDQHPARVD